MAKMINRDEAVDAILSMTRFKKFEEMQEQDVIAWDRGVLDSIVKLISLPTSEDYKMKIKLDDFALLPVRAHPDDAGLDLLSPVDCWVYAGGLKIIDTGVHVEIPEGYVGLLTSKSGLMAQGITTRGTIDASYRGSIKAVIYNDGNMSYSIRKGQKVTQLVIVPCLLPEIEIVDELAETERGEGGFRSSGL